jgi:hypothetical protein
MGANCSRVEIVDQFKDIIDSVKENLMCVPFKAHHVPVFGGVTDHDHTSCSLYRANVTLYSSLDDQVRDRCEEQVQLTKHLRQGLVSARTDLIAICLGK